jgi:hypothetical protein
VSSGASFLETAILGTAKVTARIMRGVQMGCAVQCRRKMQDAMQSKSGRGSTTFDACRHISRARLILPCLSFFLSFCVNMSLPSPVVQCDTEPARRHAVPSRSGREKREGTPRRVAHNDDN